MMNWLTTTPSNAPAASIALLAWRIGGALVLGWAVAWLYRWARRGEAVAPTFVTTLVLLATLIAMATQIIGDNIARAFSLVGALSVVRFRTVVKDTQDTAFVIFAVVVGMASGADHLAVGLVGLAILGLASIILWPPGRRGGWQAAESSLSFRVPSGGGVQATAEATLTTSAERFDLVAAGTAKQGAYLDLTYRIRLRPGTNPTGLVAELSRLGGVEDVELERSD